uniref:Uncharacterized protein n=1 Tax=Parascaris univalens TaxID=6257 RepID=A0A915ALK6_PARUN
MKALNHLLLFSFREIVTHSNGVRSFFNSRNVKHFRLSFIKVLCLTAKDLLSFLDRR